jgi:hypothetical protein
MISNHHPPPSINHQSVTYSLTYYLRYPAQHPNAAEVFYRVIKKNGNGPPVFVDDLLQTLKVPLLLLWGAYSVILLFFLLFCS